MKFVPIVICPITDQKCDNVQVAYDYFEYSIKYNNNNFTLRLSLIEGWTDGKIIKPDELVILQGLLFNNEWPVEKETIITPGLIEFLMRTGEYPRSFDEKIDQYIHRYFINGGREYKPIKFNVDKRLEFYAKDSDEYIRLFKAMQSKDLVKLPENLLFADIDFRGELTLTAKGIEEAKKLEKNSNIKQPKRFKGGRSPRITLFYTKEDEFYGKKLSELLSGLGASVVSGSGIDSNNDGYASVINSKSDLYSSENDYVIFIKSGSSDNNNTFGSILDIAIEAHENTDKRNFKYLFFGFVDDSKLQARPRLINYNNDAIDIRITTNRNRLVSYIQNDWEIRSEQRKRYSFPTMSLSYQEKIWLGAVYKKFLKDEPVYVRDLVSELWDNIDKDFEPQKINPILLSGGTDITLIGIWHVDPESDIFENFDRVVFSIIEILKNQKNITNIESAQIQEKLKNISAKQIKHIFKQLYSLGITNGFGQGENFSSNIGVGEDRIYKAFRSYEGIENLITKLYNSKTNRLEEANILGRDTTRINIKEIGAYKTLFKIKDRGDVNPVMGVLELAIDFGEIIDSLPIDKERGQMVGIFGKWGRGKTFFLSELWKVLSKKKTKYTKLEYHAWKYQETPATWAYLYEIFSKEYLGKKGVKYFLKLIWLNLNREGIWAILKLLLIVSGFTAVTFIIPKLIETYPLLNEWYIVLTAVSFLGISAVTILKNLYKEFKVEAVDLIKKYGTKNSFKAELGIQADIQEELIKLLKVWIPKRKTGKHKIILLVEDIDRCNEDKVIQNIDALRILLEDDDISKRVIIITAIDERILKNAIATKYDNVLRNPDSGQKLDIYELMSEYLDKLFISAIKLGDLTIQQKDQFLKELIKSEIHEETINEVKEIETNEFLKEVIKESGLHPHMQADLTKDIIKSNSKDSVKNFDKFFQAVKDSTLDLSIKDGDFAIKNGDIALEDKNGDTDSIGGFEVVSNERLKEQTKLEKLTAKEISLLNSFVKDWAGATPRRIRIFYYRYLLSKNLLINKYNSINNQNIWQEEEGIKLMMTLILQYSKGHNSDLISQAKNKALYSKEEDMKIVTEKEHFMMDRLHYLFLLEVLELVIAY